MTAGGFAQKQKWRVRYAQTRRFQLEASDVRSLQALWA